MLAFLLIVLVVLVVLSQAGRTSRRTGPSQIKMQGLQVMVGDGRYEYSHPELSEEERLRQSSDYWVPPGASYSQADVTIPDGMLYVGKAMVAASGWSEEPGSIDPSQPVAAKRPDILDSDLDYWPSYASAGPRDRRSYLNWLASGRRDPGADISYVFLFFYGLERRLLFDGKHLARVVGPEVPTIVAELDALLDVYASSGSFQHYCSSLIAWTKSDWDLWDDPGATPAPDPKTLRRHPSEYHRLVLGRFAADCVPLSTGWALAWLYIHPQVNLRTPAHRCPEEFHELFRVRYGDRYGEGITIRPGKKHIRLDYRPASSGLRGEQFRRETDIPDVAHLKGSINKVLAVAEAVQNELDSFSRWVGKHEDRSSAAAIARLPAALADERETSAGKQLRDWLKMQLGREDIAVVATNELVDLWPGSSDGRVTMGEARVLADFLERRSLGIEPDPRRGGKNPSRLDRIAIFRLAPGHEEAGEDLEGARLMIQLGAAVAAADGTIDATEERHLAASLEETLQLTPADRNRLRAHTARLLADPPGLSGVKARAKELDLATRQSAAHYLLGVAAADGKITTDELTLLRRIYRALDLNPDAVYSDAHALAAGTVDAGPVPVIPATEGDAGHSIPQLDAAPAEFTLDPERVERIRRESQAAAALLAEIFDPDEAEPESVDEPDEDDPVESNANEIAGLDGPHSDALMILSGRESWSRSELGELAEEHGLLAGGMVETINDAAFAASGEALLEGHDPVEVNVYALEAMLA